MKTRCIEGVADSEFIKERKNKCFMLRGYKNDAQIALLKLPERSIDVGEKCDTPQIRLVCRFVDRIQFFARRRNATPPIHFKIIAAFERAEIFGKRWRFRAERRECLSYRFFKNRHIVEQGAIPIAEQY